MSNTNKEYLGILVKIGISRKSAEIYLSLLNSGPETITGLSKNTGLYRPLLYRSLPVLLEEGLIVKVRRGKRTLWAAESPAILAETLKATEKKMAENLSDMLSLWNGSRQKSSVTTFEGKSGIAHAYEVLMLTAHRGDIIYRYESPKDRTRNKKYYPQLYWEKATGNNALVDKYVITNEKTHLARRENLNRYSKPIPEKYDPFNYDITQLILRDKVAFIDYEAETATIIENPRFAEFQTKLFKLMFKFL